MEMTCRICGLVCQGPKGLHRHIQAKHGMRAFGYYLLYLDHLQERVRAEVQEKVVVKRLGPCWEWQGGLSTGGYGRFRVAGAPTTAAHRLSYLAFRGVVLPEARVLLHRCDYPKCVNHEHLLPGTYTENNRDRDRKGRMSRGEDHYAAKLTVEKVKKIDQLRAWGWTYPEIAEEVGVARSTVDNAYNRRTFGHLPRFEPEMF